MKPTNDFGKWIWFPAAAIVVAVPATALANPSVSLLDPLPFYMLVGNFIVGVVEALVISLFFGIKKRYSMPVMIVANYLSSYVALFTHVNFLGFHWNPPLGYIWLILIGAFLLMIIAATILEWPFVLILFIKRTGKLKRSIAAAILSQAASHILLVPFLLFYGPVDAFSRCSFESASSWTANPDALLYFIGDNDGTVYRMKLDGSQKVVVATLAGRDPDNRLVFARHDSGLCDLYEKEDISYPFTKTMVVESVARNAPDTSFSRIWPGISATENEDYEDRLKEWDSLPWDVGVGTEANMSLRERNGARYLSFGMVTPVLCWRECNVTILPNDEIVFQVNRSQIMLLSMKSMKLSVLAKGHGPAVVLPQYEP